MGTSGCPGRRGCLDSGVRSGARSLLLAAEAAAAAGAGPGGGSGKEGHRAARVLEAPREHVTVPETPETRLKIACSRPPEPGLGDIPVRVFCLEAPGGSSWVSG